MILTIRPRFHRRKLFYLNKKNVSTDEYAFNIACEVHREVIFVIAMSGLSVVKRKIKEQKWIFHDSPRFESVW